MSKSAHQTPSSSLSSYCQLKKKNQETIQYYRFCKRLKADPKIQSEKRQQYYEQLKTMQDTIWDYLKTHTLTNTLKTHPESNPASLPKHHIPVKSSSHHEEHQK